MNNMVNDKITRESIKRHIILYISLGTIVNEMRKVRYTVRSLSS